MRRPADKIAGYLQVGIDPLTAEVVINHPKIDTDADGTGHIVFSPDQARALADLLKEKAHEADTMRLNALSPAVHALWHGLPRCRFTDRFPRDWPEGHTWQAPDQRARGTTEGITCAVCLAAAKETPGARPPDGGRAAKP